MLSESAAPLLNGPVLVHIQELRATKCGLLIFLSDSSISDTPLRLLYQNKENNISHITTFLVYFFAKYQTIRRMFFSICLLQKMF